MYDVFGITSSPLQKKEPKILETAQGFLFPKDLNIQPSRLTNLFLRANENQCANKFIKLENQQENVYDLASIYANNNNGLTDNEPMSIEYQNNFENILNAKSEKVHITSSNIILIFNSLG